jgi:hypothetical protein
LCKQRALNFHSAGRVHGHKLRVWRLDSKGLDSPPLLAVEKVPDVPDTAPGHSLDVCLGRGVSEGFTPPLGNFEKLAPDAV